MKTPLRHSEQGAESRGSDLISLFDLKTGHAATVVKIDKHSKPLNAIGILPGTKITLLKKKPAHLIKVGHTKIAIDNDVAKRIFVQTIRVKDR